MTPAKYNRREYDAGVLGANRVPLSNVQCQEHILAQHTHALSCSMLNIGICSPEFANRESQ